MLNNSLKGITMESYRCNDNNSNAECVREIAKKWCEDNNIKAKILLPEYDDRKRAWRTLITVDAETAVGELVIDLNTSSIIKSTDINLILKRMTRSEGKKVSEHKSNNRRKQLPPYIPNKVILGDASEVLSELPPDSVQLVFTSPPYFNAKPEYAEYLDYQEYLDSIRRVFKRCHAVLSEGRFFVVNISPILIRRLSRNYSSKRIALPFDIHSIIEKIGFEFIDDIIWAKPEGAGWATGRGRRFAADRTPLQYKAVPVTEYILVYRKKTHKLIDWNIRNHYDQKIVEESRIQGEYNATNIWNITPSHHKGHPAVFPEALAENIIRYYSFKNDLVLDPFAGTGTVAKAAMKNDRRFLVIDNEPQYYKIMTNEILPKAHQLQKGVITEIHSGMIDFYMEE
jgi:DNA modification methylase